MLADVSDRVVAVDFSEVGISKAVERCRGCDNVTFDRKTLPNEYDYGFFDLVVVSEILRYLTVEDCRELGRRVSVGGPSRVMISDYRHQHAHYYTDCLVAQESFCSQFSGVFETLSKDMSPHLIKEHRLWQPIR